MLATSTVLALCARPTGHEAQYHLLRQACLRIDDWQSVLVRAVQEGVAPLLALHLVDADIAVPAGVRRSLQLQCRRHEQYAQLLTATLTRVLMLLQGEGLSPLLLKGAALRHTLYAHPALRPMRDIDLLLDRSEVDQAQALLRQAGFVQSTAPIPADHYHLPALMHQEGEYSLCLELHWGLYPNCPPWYEPVDVAQLWRRGRDCAILDVQARSLGDEDMLLHLYFHGMRAPLTFEPPRLVSAADIIGLVEAGSDRLDWEQIACRCPQLMRALPLLHHLSPWRPGAVPAVIENNEQQRRQAVALFTGWPHWKIQTQRREGRSLAAIVRATLCPPAWWLGVYYGADSCWRRVWCLLWEHPRHVWWWIRLYAAFLDQDGPASEQSATPKNRNRVGWRGAWALWQKLTK